MRLLEASLNVLARLIDSERFVFVQQAQGERGLLTIGNALAAGQYVVFGTIENRIRTVVENGHYGRDYKAEATQFVDHYGPDVLYGLYCASEQARPCLFFAHRKHVHIAARIAIADSILRPASGFPMLIDVADATCKSAFGAAGFVALIQDAYTQAGMPLKYFSEQDARR
jgi:hypothetical protein